jgi:hypothetical protein
MFESKRNCFVSGHGLPCVVFLLSASKFITASASDFFHKNKKCSVVKRCTVTHINSMFMSNVGRNSTV